MNGDYLTKYIELLTNGSKQFIGKVTEEAIERQQEVIKGRAVECLTEYLDANQIEERLQEEYIDLLEQTVGKLHAKLIDSENTRDALQKVYHDHSAAIIASQNVVKVEVEKLIEEHKELLEVGLERDEYNAICSFKAGMELVYKKVFFPHKEVIGERAKKPRSVRPESGRGTGDAV